MITVIADGRWGRRVVDFWRERVQNQVITWGVRTPAFAAELAGDVQNVRVATYADAIGAHSVIVVAIPIQDLLQWARAHASSLKGKVIIDMSSPLTDESLTLYGWRTSGTEQLQKTLPASGVVGMKGPFLRALAGGWHRGRASIYVTSDDDDAKTQAFKLLCGSDDQLIDAGKLEENRAIDRISSMG